MILFDGCIYTLVRYDLVERLRYARLENNRLGLKSQSHIESGVCKRPKRGAVVVAHHHYSNGSVRNHHEVTDKAGIPAGVRDGSMFFVFPQEPTDPDLLPLFTRRFPHEVVGRILQDSLAVELSSVHIGYSPARHIQHVRIKG